MHVRALGWACVAVGSMTFLACGDAGRPDAGLGDSAGPVAEPSDPFSSKPAVLGCEEIASIAHDVAPDLGGGEMAGTSPSGPMIGGCGFSNGVDLEIHRRASESEPSFTWDVLYPDDGNAVAQVGDEAYVGNRPGWGPVFIARQGRIETLFYAQNNDSMPVSIEELSGIASAIFDGASERER